jgi:hypothetical protein
VLYPISLPVKASSLVPTIFQVSNVLLKPIGCFIRQAYVLRLEMETCGCSNTPLQYCILKHLGCK